MISFEMLAFNEVVNSLQRRLKNGVLPIDRGKKQSIKDEKKLYYYKDSEKDEGFRGEVNDGVSVIVSYDIASDCFTEGSSDAYRYIVGNYDIKLYRQTTDEGYSWYINISPYPFCEGNETGLAEWTVDVYTDSTVVWE